VDVFEVVAGGQQQYLRDAVARAARELDLERAMPATAGELARRLVLRSERRLRRLLDALALFGLVRREGDVFHAQQAATPAPVPDGGWGQLAEVIRTDRPVPEPGVSGLGAPESLRRFHDSLFTSGTEPARELWTALGARGRLLDLGGGAGAYSAAFAAFDGEATLTDTPAVLRLSRAPRATLLPLDLLRDAYPGGYDVVLLANVLHLFGEADCRAIVRKAAAALAKGGRLVVKDLLIEPDRSGPAEGVLFALNMALFTGQGDVHDPGTVEGWLREAGASAPARWRLQSSPGSLVLSAAKP